MVTRSRPKRLQSAADAAVQEVAPGGLLDRRQFLRGGLSAALLAPLPVGVLAATGARTEASLAADDRGAGTDGGAAADTAPHTEPQPALASTRTPGAPFSNYGTPSEYESDVVRWISDNPAAPGNGISWTPLHELEGTLTPNGLHFERHHNGVPDIDPAEHRLRVEGLVEQALEFSVDDLLRYPMQSVQCVIECGGNSNAGWNKRPLQAPVGYFHGLVSASEWVGVPVRHLLAEAGNLKSARWVVAEGADAIEHHMSIPMARILDSALIGLYQNGERLRPENGYPMRLLVPGCEGVLHVKWLRRLTLTDRPVMSRNETSRYTELLPSGKARAFTFVMQPKSIITSPSCGMTLPERGFYEIKGLAWSGRGSIRKVEVSADGGRNWAEAALDTPVQPRAFTRFRIPWRWNGQPATLVSRATDETGETQPTRRELVAARGRNGYFHYNAQVSYAVLEDGYLEHVYLEDDDEESVW